MPKYNNRKIEFDGYKFDSLVERDYYRYLVHLKDNNHIKDFEVHPKFELQQSFRYKKKTIRAITYTADFKVIKNDGTIDIVDVKGVKTNEFKIKEKLFKFKFKDDNNINIYCVKLHKGTWVSI